MAESDVELAIAQTETCPECRGKDSQECYLCDGSGAVPVEGLYHAEWQQLQAILASSHALKAITGLAYEVGGRELRRGPLAIRADGCGNVLGIEVCSLGKRFPIDRTEDGPWWDYLRRQIPKMQAEIQTYIDRCKAEEAAAEARERAARATQLEKIQRLFEAALRGEPT